MNANLETIKKIDFEAIRSVLTSEQKRALAWEFIDIENCMYSYGEHDHPAVLLHRFTFNLFSKKGECVNDFVDILAINRKESIENILKNCKDILDIF
jgi:hypothetical protein